MLGKFGCFVIAVALVLPVCAADRPGSISGYVRSTAGAPQMGAVVEVIGSAMQGLKVFTDENGFYSANGLLPGFYSIRVSAPSFLTAEHERVGLHAGAILILNVTLSTLFDSVRLAPVRGSTDEDDWKWVLRSAANRPILRALDPGSGAARESNKGNHDFKGTLSFLAGSPSQGFGGSSDMSTEFSVQRSLFTEGTVAIRGNVGYGQVSPATVLRASYSRKMENGSEPQLAITFRNLASPDENLRGAGLQALALTTSDNLTLSNLELNFGTEMQTVQFLGRVSVVRPFGTADFHVSPDTVVEYRYATSAPDPRIQEGFVSTSDEFNDSGPRMSVAGFASALEHAHHQEVSVSHRCGKNSLQFALYSDRISDPALTGVGDPSGDNGQVLSDIFSGTFTYRGKNLDTHGTRIVFERKLSSDITATMDYSYGGVLDLGRDDVALADARQLSLVRNRHSATMKVSGTLPVTKSRWIASYGWVSGRALTQVDSFNTSAGRADPYLDMFFRQPIPGTGFIPGHMEAMLEVRNLLAQGYVPVLGNDGKTVYLVQSAHAVRGGLAFSF
jgi:Carboxypeptidase regulatory-like domain